MRKIRIAAGLLIGCALAFALAGCGSSDSGESADTGDRTMEAKTLHVAPTGSDEQGDGTEEAPFATIGGAIACGSGPGSETIVHGGTYGPVEITGAEAVEKSYPGFFRDYRELGGTAEPL